MALEKQLVPIVFEKGINQDPDEKVLPLGDLTLLEDGYWTKKGTLKTRPGFETLTTTTVTGGTNGGGRSCHNLGEESVIVGGTDNNQLYSFSNSDTSWVNKGENLSREMKEDSIIQNQHGQAWHDAARTNGIEVYAWVDTRSGSVRASAYDTVSKNFIISDAEIHAGGTSRQYPDHVRCAVAGNFIFIVFSAFIGSSTYLWNSIFDTNSPDEFPTKTLANTFGAAGYYGFDICEYDATNIAIALQSSASDIRVMYLDTDGVAGTIATVATGATSVRSQLQIIKQASDDSLYVIFSGTGYASLGEKLAYFARDSDLTSKLAVTDIEAFDSTDDYIPWFNRFAACWSDADTLTLFYERQGVGPEMSWEDAESGHQVCTPTVRKVTLDDDGTVGTPEDIAYHTQIGAFPWLYGSEIYIPLVFVGIHSEDLEERSLQTTGFVCNSDGEIVNKYLRSVCGIELKQESNDNIYAHEPPHVMEVSTGVYAFPAMKMSNRAGWPTQGTTFGGITSIGTPYPHDGVGIVRMEIDLSSTEIQDATEIGDSLFFSGGVLKQYDGANFVESGFNLYPEALRRLSDEFTVTVTQDGAVGAAEITELEVTSGGQIVPLSSVTFYYSGGDTEFVFFIDDVNRTLQGSDVGVEILSTDTEDEVATKLAAAIDGESEFGATSSGNTVTVTNASFGVVTEASIGDINKGVLSDGTRSYRAIYSWVDNNGRVYRSAPSVAKQVVLSGGGSTQKTVIAVPSLGFTDKTDSKPIIDLYRTEDLGTIYYQINNKYAELGTEEKAPLNKDDSPYTYFVDNTTDTDLVDNPILYTTGGVIENIGPTQASVIMSTKDRVFVADNNSNVIQFTKKISDQKGLQFSDLLTVGIPDYAGYISAFATLDEKIITFKPTATFWMIGDGPNDLGAGGFTSPQFISRDIGCDEPLSIQNTPLGVIFKSNKGWYLLNRSLQLEFIGSQVEDLSSLVVTGSYIRKDVHQVFWSSSTDLLMYDYHYKQWAVWKNLGSVGLSSYGDKMALLKGSGATDGQLWYEDGTASTNEDPDGNFSSLHFTTGWIQLSQLQGFQRIRRIMMIGDFKKLHSHQFRIYRDYATTSPDEVDYVSETADVKKFQINLPVQKCSAIKIDYLQYMPPTSGEHDQSEVTGMTFEVGVKRGTRKEALVGKAGTTYTFVD